MAVKKSGFHYAWIICLACTLSAACSLGIATSVFSVYMAPLMDAYGFSKAEVSAIPTIATFVCTIFILIGSRIYRVIGLRWGVAAGLISFAVANLFFANATQLTGFYVGAFFSGVPTAISGILPISIIITNWFEEKRGLALGLSMSGSGLGTIVAPPIIARSITANGLTATFLYEAVFVFFLCAVVVFLLRAKPEDMGLHRFGARPGGAPAEAGVPQGGPDASSRVYFTGKKPVALLLVAMFLFGYIGCAVTSHISVHYVALGYENTFAANMVSIFGFCVICGKLLLGIFTDHFGCYKTNYIHFGLLFCAMALFCVVDKSLIAAYLSPLLLGLGHPILSIGTSLWLPELFKPARYAPLLNAAMFLIYLGGSVGTIITGLVADFTGNYIASFLLMLACGVVGALIVQGAFIRLRRANLRRPSAHMP